MYREITHDEALSKVSTSKLAHLQTVSSSLSLLLSL